MKKQLLSFIRFIKSLIILLLFSGVNFAQIVNIPDANFKAFLVADASINTNMDTEIQVSEANAYTGTIDVSSQGITDLTGIEAFTSIANLNADDNSITSVDLSQNTQLTNLHLTNNDLLSLDLSSNNLIAILRLEVNPNLSSLILGNNPNLQTLVFSSCNLSTLDVSLNSGLIYVWGQSNELNTIDLSSNLLVQDIRLGGNNLVDVDLSMLPLLTVVSLESNNLSSLNVKNGANTNITTFFATGNPNLTCIEVDDPVYSAANWTVIDATASFSTDCCIVNIPDAAFKNYLVGNTSINTNLDSEIQCSEATAFNSYLECQNLGITDMTGLEAFTSINGLYCHSNNLDSLDVSQNTGLTFLWCYGNQLDSLDISQNTSLITLRCNSNNLTNLDLSNNPSLSQVWCNSNNLSSLDVYNNTNLTDLRCFNNPIMSLDVSANTALQTLYCYQNQLTSIDVSNNTSLTKLRCNVNQINSLDVSNNTALIDLYCSSNLLTDLNVSVNTALENLSCGDNPLETIDVSNNTNLTYLHCYQNDLTDLDISNNLLLEKLYCYENQLTDLDVSAHTALYILWCYDNELYTLNAANGNNLNIITSNFKVMLNPDLKCVQVDDVMHADTTFTFKNTITSYSIDCAAECSQTTTSINPVECYNNSYTSPTGQVYTMSATYTETLRSSWGWCDSIITINLIINETDTTLSVTSNMITANESGATYQWLDCDNNSSPIAGETNQSFSPSSDGNYAVIITKNGCVDTSACQSITLTSDGIESYDQESYIHIFPNPNNGSFTLNANKNLVNATVQLMEVTGKIITTSYLDNSLSLNFNLTKGIYLIQITDSDQQTYTSKVIVR